MEKYQWNEVYDENDMMNLMHVFGHFHDSCIKEIRYVSGAFVGDDLAMNPINTIRTVDVIFQRQSRNPMVIVIRFIGLDTLHLSPHDRNYTCEILGALIFAKKEMFYWADYEYADKDQIEEYDGTWLCAEKIQWRIIDECIGNDDVFVPVFV